GSKPCNYRESAPTTPSLTRPALCDKRSRRRSDAGSPLHNENGPAEMRRMNQRNFFAELKRRNVYKVAVAYAIIAWLLIQAASILFPTFEAPAWAMRIFVTAVALGFPIALILAWALKLTPEGIKLTESGNGDLAKPTRSKVWIYIAAIGGVLSVGLFSLGRYTAVRTSSPGSVQSADP